jgi:Fic family protein
MITSTSIATKPLESIFANRGIAKILDIFMDSDANISSTRYTADQVVSLTGLSLRTVRVDLATLRRKNLLSIVDKQKRADVYQLSDSYLVEKLRNLATATAQQNRQQNQQKQQSAT